MTEFSVVKISPAAFENVEEIEGGAAEKYRVTLPDLGTVILKLDIDVSAVLKKLI